MTQEERRIYLIQELRKRCLNMTGTRFQKTNKGNVIG